MIWNGVREAYMARWRSRDRGGAQLWVADRSSVGDPPPRCFAALARCSESGRRLRAAQRPSRGRRQLRRRDTAPRDCVINPDKRDCAGNSAAAAAVCHLPVIPSWLRWAYRQTSGESACASVQRHADRRSAASADRSLHCQLITIMTCSDLRGNQRRVAAFIVPCALCRSPSGAVV